MKMLIDTNLLIDYFSKRPLFFADARTIRKLCVEHQGFSAQCYSVNPVRGLFGEEKKMSKCGIIIAGIIRQAFLQFHRDIFYEKYFL